MYANTECPDAALGLAFIAYGRAASTRRQEAQWQDSIQILSEMSAYLSPTLALMGWLIMVR